jgi:hypothetical protein
MPVVPRMLIPPSMPRRGFQVCLASSAPLSTAMVTSKSTGEPWAAAASISTPLIIWRGTGLMAGAPGGTGRPGLVTVPTPSPAWNRMPEPGGAGATRVRIVARWVTSGSSPASLMTAASAQPGPVAVSAISKEGVSPRGRVMVTLGGKPPPRSARTAALAAAVAQAPVVQPERSLGGGDLLIRMDYRGRGGGAEAGNAAGE